MKRLPTASPVVFVAWLAALTALSLSAAEPTWTPLADGQTLKGWHVNGMGTWTVEDGVYVGRSDNAPLYGHLVSDDTFQDFTVRFQFLCPSGDSGFFIRTRMEDPDRTIGLQVQVGPPGSGTGGIYESYGRGWLQQPDTEQEKTYYRQGAWNEMVIDARGNRVIVHVNGVKTADVTDDQMARDAGVFALQMHSGVVNETRFKQLELLQEGKIHPKRFVGLVAPAVTPAADGSLSLHAAAGVGIGPQIQYMVEWGAFGWFMDKDRVEWPLEIPRDGTYEVWMEWSVADDHAGNPFALEIGEARLEGTVERTGSWETYRRAKIGQVTLAAGKQRAVFRPAGEFATALLDLREITLKPLASGR